MNAVTTDDFSREIANQLTRAAHHRRSHLEVNAGELHRIVGQYPYGGNHRMPSCCHAMKSMMQAGDEIVFGPASGKGPSLTIRYHLPRK